MIYLAPLQGITDRIFRNLFPLYFKGAGMLCYPLRVESFLEKMFSSLKPKLSIKLRIGMEYPEEILQLIPIFNRYPIEELIIHPRTGRQMYGGDVDLDMFVRPGRLF